MKKLIVLLLVSSVSLIGCGNLLASDDDLNTCVHDGQRYYDAHVCDVFRQEKADDDARNQRDADVKSGANLESCHWNTGNTMPGVVCDMLRKEQAEKDAHQKEQDEQINQAKNEVVAFAQFIPVDDFNKCKWRNGKKIIKSICSDLKDEIEYFAQVSAKLKSITGTNEVQLHDHLNKLKEVHQYLTDLTDRRFKLSSRPSDPYNNSCTEFRPAVAGERVDMPCDPDNKTVQEIAQEKEEAAQKRKCGKDYQTMRLGITIARLQECSGAIYMTKTVSQAGVIETYRTMFDYVDVQDGKVISFTKRRY